MKNEIVSSIEESLKILAANPPPPLNYAKLFFFNIGKCIEANRILEQALGLAPRKATLKIKVENQYHAQLLGIQASRKAAKAPVTEQTPSVVTPTPAQVSTVSEAQKIVASPVPAVGALSRQKQVSLARILGISIGPVGREMSSSELLPLLEKVAYQNYVRFETMREDSAIADSGVWRGHSPGQLTGIGRIVRAELQRKINETK